MKEFLMYKQIVKHTSKLIPCDFEPYRGKVGIILLKLTLCEA